MARFGKSPENGAAGNPIHFKGSGAAPEAPGVYNPRMNNADFPSAKRGRPRLRLGPNQRLKGRQTVDQVYKTGRKRVSHPLSVHALRRADNGPSRLGISIGRKVGNAVQRNRIKRLLREAYRLAQQEWPIGMDYLVIVRPHKALTLEAYQAKLRQLLR